MADVRQAESDAGALLERAWHGWLPVDPEFIALGLGILVRSVSLPADESGNIVIPSNGDVIITLNRDDHPNRRRFTCAHELGHYHRRSQSGRAGTFIDYRDTLAGLGSDPEEIYANQFAAALLMPARHVQQHVNRGCSAQQMAGIFGTSVQAMQIRLENLNIRPSW